MMFNRSRLGRAAAAVARCGAACGSLLAVAVPAGAGTVEYNSSKKYTITPSGTLPPTVSVDSFAHSWLNGASGDPAGEQSAVDPAAQPAAYDPLGFESVDAGGRILNTNRAKAFRTIANRQTDNVAPAGTSAPVGAMTSKVLIDSGNSFGTTTNTVNPFGSSGSAVSGTVAANGQCVANFNSARSYGSSFSVASFQGRRALGNGTISLLPKQTLKRTRGSFDTVVGKGTIADPVVARISDPVTGVVAAEYTLLQVTGTITGPDTSFDWDSEANNGAGTFSVSTPDPLDTFDYDLVMNTPFTVQQGEIHLQIRAGLITRSDDSGVFNGLLPAVGSPGTFTRPLGGLTLSYNLNIPAAQDPNVTISFAVGGTGSENVLEDIVPEPSAAGLVACAGVALGLRRRRRRRGRAGASRR